MKANERAPVVRSKFKPNMLELFAGRRVAKSTMVLVLKFGIILVNVEINSMSCG
jgi:hypothetical protein